MVYQKHLHILKNRLRWPGLHLSLYQDFVLSPFFEFFFLTFLLQNITLNLPICHVGLNMLSGVVW